MKYSTYEEAVYRALLDVPAPTPAEASRAGGGAVVVMVVGAGRGPLVKASLRAGERAGRPLHVYAVEKNPNAVVHLHALHAAQRWGARVTIVSHDMRTWDAPAKARIMVSELLGSFGDNELSPECLDGARLRGRCGGSSNSGGLHVLMRASSMFVCVQARSGFWRTMACPSRRRTPPSWRPSPPPSCTTTLRRVQHAAALHMHTRLTLRFLPAAQNCTRRTTTWRTSRRRTW
jgi:hypothetical protein